MNLIYEDMIVIVICGCEREKIECERIINNKMKKKIYMKKYQFFFLGIFIVLICMTIVLIACSFNFHTLTS